jgi:DNA-binding NarL/FixJ family response regulator
MKKISILLADDHKIVREGLKLLINSQPDLQVVGEAGTGKEVLQMARDLKPALVVMDLSMPELNGLQATELLRAKQPEVKIVALTVHEDPSYLRQLCAAGAAGYVLKRSAGDELIKAIRKVLEGGLHFDPTLAGKALAGLTRELPAAHEPHAKDLSDREKEVLIQLAWGNSNKEIADKMGLSVKTVQTYRVRIAEKLGFHTRTEIVAYALRQGWLNEN